MADLSVAWRTPVPIRAAFFDVDGTMLSLSQNCEPASTRAAISRLKEAGIMPILATGRSSYLLDRVDLSDFGGFITFNGQLVEVGGKTIHSNPLDKDDIAAVVHQVQEGMYTCLFMERERMYMNEMNEHVQAMIDLTHNSYSAGNAAWALDNDVYQLNMLVGPGEEKPLLSVTHRCKVTRWCDVFADVMPVSGGKDAGVRLIMHELGLVPEECVAFGDGGNDIDMFRVVGSSVAMGNGNPEAKEAATYVTDHIDHDGLWNACVRLGLFDGALLGEEEAL